jgi:hypothetical protein
VITEIHILTLVQPLQIQKQRDTRSKQTKEAEVRDSGYGAEHVSTVPTEAQQCSGRGLSNRKGKKEDHGGQSWHRNGYRTESQSELS